MPHIKEVNIESRSIVAGSPGVHHFDADVTAKIQFSESEQRLGLVYNTRIALYEIDAAMDVYSAFPNAHELFLQRAARGDKDEFLGFSSLMRLEAQQGDVAIEHTFSVRATFESDQRMELKALVVCVPDTATAMKWSPTKSVQVING